jgi:hypothetical protein
MRRRTYWILGGLLAVFLAAFLVLKLFSTDIVHLAVMNAVIQKAPEAYDAGRIRLSFEQAYRTARMEDRKEAYLQELLRISSRLEKIQYLEERQVDQLLVQLQSSESFEPFPEEEQTGR